MERDEQKRREPRPDEREPRPREVAPPVEREHETAAGVFEEDQRRERERAPDQSPR
jgi:hypothetical protein